MNRFERGEASAEVLSASLNTLNDIYQADPPDEGKLWEAFTQMLQRVEMVVFSVCAAQRRGAVAEIVAEFRASQSF